MSFTAPKTWVTDENPSAATMNTHVRDNLDAAAGAAKASCRVYNSAAISISNVAVTALTFDSERHDSQGLHSTSSLTGRITVPTGWGGLWMVGANVKWAGSTTGVRLANIRLNGTTIIAEDYQPAHATVAAENAHAVTTIYRLAAADYLEVTVYQSSGAALNVQVASGSPEFWAVWLAA